jgi:hypothetical protein
MLSVTGALLPIIASSTVGTTKLMTQEYGKYKTKCHIETSSFYSVGEGWMRSDKEDDIETFYRYEKTGSDKFQVDIKIVNNRSKPVRVRAQVQYKSGGGVVRRYLVSDHNHEFLTQPSLLSGSCEIVIPSGSSRVCEGNKSSGEENYWRQNYSLGQRK